MPFAVKSSLFAFAVLPSMIAFSQDWGIPSPAKNSAAQNTSTADVEFDMAQVTAERQLQQPFEALCIAVREAEKSPMNINRTATEAGGNTVLTSAINRMQAGSYDICDSSISYKGSEPYRFRAGMSDLLFDKKLYRINHSTQKCNEYGRAFMSSA